MSIVEGSCRIFLPFGHLSISKKRPHASVHTRTHTHTHAKWMCIIHKKHGLRNKDSHLSIALQCQQVASWENQLCFPSPLRKRSRILLGSSRSARHTLFIASSPTPRSCRTPSIPFMCLLSCSTLGSWRWWGSPGTGTPSASPSQTSCPGKFCSGSTLPSHVLVNPSPPGSCFLFWHFFYGS